MLLAFLGIAITMEELNNNERNARDTLIIRRTLVVQCGELKRLFHFEFKRTEDSMEFTENYRVGARPLLHSVGSWTLSKFMKSVESVTFSALMDQ